MNYKHFLLGLLALALLPGIAHAVTLYADLTPDGNYNTSGGITSVSTTDYAEIALSGTDEVYFSFIATSSEFVPGDSITLTGPTGYTLAACTAATDDADADGTDDGSFDHTITTSSVYTFTATTTAALTTGVEFCLTVTTNGTANNDVITLSSSSTAPQTGATFIYNGDDNDIFVTALVQTSIFFALRNGADSANTNACDLGTLTTGAVNTCDYRLAITSNESNGFTAYIRDTSANAGLTANSGADDIDAIVEDSGTVTAGSELYGVEFAAGNTSTEQGVFTDDDTPIPTTTTAIVQATAPYQYTTGVTSTSHLVTHRASIDANTSAGSYTQTVSYYVTGNF